MSNVFWMLMLAHLVGDYPLQPDWMVQAKRTWRGLTLHVGVHLAMLLILAGTGRSAFWPFLLALAAMHFAIDFQLAGRHCIDQARRCPHLAGRLGT